MTVTIKDIAKRAGVSVSTVSMALGKKKYPLSEKTRSRILFLAQEMGYIPNEMARSLVERKTNAIGIVTPNLANPYFSEMIQEAIERTQKRGYHVLVIHKRNEGASILEVERLYKSHFIAGALIILTHYHGKEASRLGGTKGNFVFLDTIPARGGRYVVMNDDHEGGQQVARHLRERGYQSPLIIGGPRASKNSENRILGFMEQWNQFNLTQPEVLHGNYDYESGYSLIRKYNLKDRDSIFCCNDAMALGAMKALKERHLMQKIGLVGYDNLSILKYVTPRLTTVNQHAFRAVQKAVNTLIALIEGEECGPFVDREKPELIAGETTLGNRLYEDLE